jgi:hypothetical protein
MKEETTKHEKILSPKGAIVFPEQQRSDSTILNNAVHGTFGNFSGLSMTLKDT